MGTHGNYPSSTSGHVLLLLRAHSYDMMLRHGLCYVLPQLPLVNCVYIGDVVLLYFSLPTITVAANLYYPWETHDRLKTCMSGQWMVTRPGYCNPDPVAFIGGTTKPPKSF